MKFYTIRTYPKMKQMIKQYLEDMQNVIAA